MKQSVVLLVRFTVTNLNNISGENIVGGFIGAFGPSDLGSETDNGLTVNLLGLNYILKLSSLSLGQAVEVNIDSSVCKWY